MNMVLALSALAVSFSFAGGDADAFAKSLSEATGKPVLMVSPTRQKFPAFEKTTETIRSLSNAVADAFDFQNGGTDDLGFCETSYPSEIVSGWATVMGGNRVERLSTPQESSSGEDLADSPFDSVMNDAQSYYEVVWGGETSFRFVSKLPVRLRQVPSRLMPAFFSTGKRRFGIPQALATLPLSGYGAKTTEEEFLKAVAAAIGAKLTVSPVDKSPQFEVYADIFRLRMAGAFRSKGAETVFPYLKYRYALAAAVTAQMDDPSAKEFAAAGTVQISSSQKLRPKVAGAITSWIRTHFSLMQPKTQAALTKMSPAKIEFKVTIATRTGPTLSVTDGTQTVEL
jgi:hypothetical protein